MLSFCKESRFFSSKSSLERFETVELGHPGGDTAGGGR